MLRDVLQNRRWERHHYPFPYLYAQNVFVDNFYKQLEAEFNELLARGLHDVLKALPLTEKEFCSARQGGSRTGYDAYGAGIQPDTIGAMSVFKGREWHDMMASLFGVTATGYILAGMHHHKVGSKSWVIHNDFNSVWFPITEAEGPTLPNIALCSYKSGEGPLRADEKIEVCRAVSMIFYLCNGEWHDGDGGETGFYTDRRESVDAAVRKIPPHDNSLIMFEPTPKTWHSFVTNTVKPRNNVIMWIHRPIEEAQNLYGDENLERWR